MSAARKWGGEPEHYIEIEEFLDSSKEVLGDVRHRAIYHHTSGVWLCQKIFGRIITVPKKNGHGTVEVPVRLVAEQHILEDLGWLPSPADYLKGMPIAPWMSGSQRKELPLSHLLKQGVSTEWATPPPARASSGSPSRATSAAPSGASSRSR